MTTIRAEEVMSSIDYADFIRIINEIPSNVFYKDKDLKYRFSTHCWSQLISDDINGKTDLEVRKDKDNAIIAMETDKNIIRTGVGCKYIIRSEIDGEVSFLELIKEPVKDEFGNVLGIVGLINDVTEKTLLEQKLKELNTFDALTGVFNRRVGTEQIIAKLRDNNSPKAFCLLDLDHFKIINDIRGHQIGDRVLKEFGQAIRDTITQQDIAMRLGGDEFIVLLNGVTKEAEINEFLGKLRAKMKDIVISDQGEKLKVSCGVTLVDRNNDLTFDELYSLTDKNMYYAKKVRDGKPIIE